MAKPLPANNKRDGLFPFSVKATERDRTADLLITNQLLYQLSYGGG